MDRIDSILPSRFRPGDRVVWAPPLETPEEVWQGCIVAIAPVEFVTRQSRQVHWTYAVRRSHANGNLYPPHCTYWLDEDVLAHATPKKSNHMIEILDHDGTPIDWIGPMPAWLRAILSPP